MNRVHGALVAIAMAGAGLTFTAPTTEAGVIQRACSQSERGGRNAALCACIQGAADATLSRRDQRLAAGFFQNPHRAQEIRMSDRPNHEVFWERYRQFGEVAEAYCG